MNFAVQIVLYHLLMLASVFLLLDRLRMRLNASEVPEDEEVPSPYFGFTKVGSLIFLYGIFGFCAAVLFAVIVGLVTAGQISGQRFAEGLFFEGALFLFLAARNWTRPRARTKTNDKDRVPAVNRFAAGTLMLFAVLFAAIGMNSLYYEPWNLQVKTYTVKSNRITKPLKIVFIADIQTDFVTSYEHRALRLAKSLNGDLILFGGDYQQSYHGGPKKSIEGLRKLFQESNLSAPLGMYAVQGNHEWFGGWHEMFDGTGIEAFPETCIVPIKNGSDTILLELLTQKDSRNVRWQTDLSRLRNIETENVAHDLSSQKRHFLIALGHVPSFAGSEKTADLLLAGHTHGGQVCIPGVGPIVTLTPGIPNSWGSGRTELPGGGTLIVSNGIGMERREAPRIRFWCPPQIVVIDLVPAKAP